MNPFEDKKPAPMVTDAHRAAILKVDPDIRNDVALKIAQAVLDVGHQKPVSRMDFNEVRLHIDDLAKKARNCHDPEEQQSFINDMNRAGWDWLDQNAVRYNSNDIKSLISCVKQLDRVEGVAVSD